MKNITVTGIALAMLLLAGTPVLAENPVEPERLARISRRALRRTMQKPARRTIPLRRVVYPIPLPHPEYPWGRAQKLSCKLVVVGFLPAPFARKRLSHCVPYIQRSI